MAQVFGPLMSESASGQIAQTLIYQRYRGKNYVKAYGKPDWDVHPPTGPQLAVQAMNKLLMEAWPGIAELDKATWDALAIPQRLSRVNVYLRENFKRLRSGRLATDFWPAVETPPYPTTATVSGELDPDATGTYDLQEAQFNDQPCYKHETEEYYIFYDNLSPCWTIAATLANAPENGWVTNAETMNADDYNPVGAIYTGTAEVSSA